MKNHIAGTDIQGEMTLAFEQVRPSAEQVLQSIHYSNECTDDVVCDTIRRLLRQTAKKAEIRGGYNVLPVKQADHKTKSLILDKTVLDTKGIIFAQLRKADYLFVFAVTAGQRLSRWADEFVQKGDPFTAYLADAIASETVERAADWLEDFIGEKMAELGLNITNRYSPGYCGWDVSEQKKLFSLLQKNCCNITLTESSLMLPVKSVSGVIGVGETVRKVAYQCAVCDKEDCYLRRRPQEVTE
ncbi:MAG TPA: hypothetical protein EYP36_13510 [Calditrichaeota bacterium]|nr:hypothetical protein [Calditrichota bacterium]